MAEAARKLAEHDDPRSRSILRIEQFRLADIMRILSMPKWRVLNYCKSKHVLPSIQDSSGPGTRRIFNRIDLYNIAVLWKVVGDGIDLRDNGVTYWITKLFQPKPGDVEARAKSLGISLEKASEKIQEEDWLNRDAKNRVFVTTGNASRQYLIEDGAKKCGWPGEVPRFIDRAKPKGKKEFLNAIEYYLNFVDSLDRRAGSVYVLEIDRLLDGVDAKL
jgi:hypothetical protein